MGSCSATLAAQDDVKVRDGCGACASPTDDGLPPVAGPSHGVTLHWSGVAMCSGVRDFVAYLSDPSGATVWTSGVLGPDVAHLDVPSLALQAEGRYTALLVATSFAGLTQELSADLVYDTSPPEVGTLLVFCLLVTSY